MAKHDDTTTDATASGGFLPDSPQALAGKIDWAALFQMLLPLLIQLLPLIISLFATSPAAKAAGRKLLDKLTATHATVSAPGASIDWAALLAQLLPLILAFLQSLIKPAPKPTP